MAELRVHGDGTTTDKPEEIASFTSDYGVDFEQWNIDKLQAEDGRADEDEIMDVFDEEIESLKAQGNYNLVDVVSLTPDTPDLEVRFVVDGRGVFTIHPDEGPSFDVELHAGDLIVIPDGTEHAFTLCEDKNIQCIRFFQSEDGWEAHYD
jgi:1,2-dihydroxy-3-keto-5-methylthiopentene dioxygenase